MYVCGITPYDATHLGHAATYLAFDLVYRVWRDAGRQVRYVQNVTDVDDPLFAKARDLGMDYRELAAQCIAIFMNDLRDMNMLMPAVTPRVSEEIPYIQETVRALVDRDLAYATDGYVFFRASRFPAYGVMSRLDVHGMMAADKETGEDPDDPRKEGPLDFRLWQPSRSDEPAWPSPWGDGRPGWHIECSTMASRHLGPQIDIHGGGEDLIFPHHCSEIAQSESATGLHPFVRYWMHVGLVFMDGEKMSKSLGNLAFVRDLTPRYGGDALRYYLLGFPYRERMEYRESDLAAAASRWDVVARAAAREEPGPETPAGKAAREACLAALDDDLNTPRVLEILDDLAERGVGDGSDASTLRSLLALLGFRLAGQA
jgi:L-cysteine:1D-myo-inositol 2-amino-2-deoxy-alpha-D-glucopyranoside ligase